MVIENLNVSKLFYDHLLGNCTIAGKEYEPGQKFISEDCTGYCTCKAANSVSCVSLCPPMLVRCHIGEKIEEFNDYIDGSKCYCKRERCVKGNVVTQISIVCKGSL